MARFTVLERILVPTYDDPDQMTPGTVEFDHENCTGCSLCVQACPADSISFKDKKPYLRPPGENQCVACADCVAICPRDAVRLTSGYRFTQYFKTIDQRELRRPRLCADERPKNALPEG